MYERFYGLTRTPFAVTPDPAMLFMSKVHREALATIIYGVETRKGFIVCTGEVGTGKSTIVRAFFDQMDADALKLIYIFTPQVSPFEMSQYVCREFGLDEPESVFAAVPRLQLKLLEEFESGRTVVLMIDEAQLLPTETLEFLRLLSNFETDTEKLIQIVLIGQPEIDTTLARHDMRQVNQRVALRARLGSFSVEESFDYIQHRLRISGAEELGQVMSLNAARLIAEAAGGIPRVINILADNALIAGFGMGQRPLGSRLARTAIREFLGKSEAARPVRGQRFAAGQRTLRWLRRALPPWKLEPGKHRFAALPAPEIFSQPVAAPQMLSREKNPSPPAGVIISTPPGAPCAEPAVPRNAVICADRVAPIDESVSLADAPVSESSRPTGGPPLSGYKMFPVQPMLDPEQWGMPVSNKDIPIIEPTAARTVGRISRAGSGTFTVAHYIPPNLSIPPSPVKVGNDGAAMRPSDAEPRVANEEPVVSVAAPSATGYDNHEGPAMRWPALSRVRSSLRQSAEGSHERSRR